MVNDDLHFTDYLEASFQELVLALLTRNQAFLAKARGLVEAKYFVGQVYREILKALYAYWDANHSLPADETLVIAVSKATDDETTRHAYTEAVRRILNYDDDELDHSFIQDELVEFVCRAKAATAVMQSWRELKTFDIGVLNRELTAIQQLPVLFTQLGPRVRKDWGLIYDEEFRTQFPTGYANFDKALRGGARGGELVVILAPLKRGKTACLINIGRALAEMGCTVVHYTLEMYERDVLRRYLASLTRRPINKITDYEVELRGLNDRLAEYTEGDVIIKEFPGKMATVEMIEGHLSMVEAATKPVIPIIDYADLLATPRGVEQWMAMEDIYIQLRNLGARHGVPVFTASQTNAAGFNADELDASHQSASTRKGFVADFMFGVQQSKIDYAANRFTMIPFLNRHERKDLVSYWRAWYDCSRIEEVSEDEYINLQPDLGMRLRQGASRA